MLKFIFIVFYIKNLYIFAKEIITKTKQNETKFKRLRISTCIYGLCIYSNINNFKPILR